MGVKPIRKRLLNNAKNFAFTHNKQFFTVDFDGTAGVLAK